MEKIINDFAMRTAQLNHNHLLRNEYFDRFKEMFDAKCYNISAMMLINGVVTDALDKDAALPLEHAYVMALDMLEKLERFERKTSLAFAA